MVMRGWGQGRDVISTLSYKLLHNDMVIGELYFEYFIFLMIIWNIGNMEYRCYVFL